VVIMSESPTVGGLFDEQLLSRLLHQRIIVLGQEVDDPIANRICAQLLLLAAEDDKRDIFLYINSPGGSFTAMTAIYDTMQYIRPDVQTFVIGQAASAAAVLLGAGAKGKRFALPNSRVLIHQPAIEGTGGMASDL
jgi:ATP-dependent Clp protease protease subunit